MKGLSYLLYNSTVIPTLFILFRIGAIFNSKIRRGLRERRKLFENLINNLASLDRSKKMIWFHSSSMGEFEQAKPIIQKFRGGRKGGGTELTQLGEDLLRYYTRLEHLIQATLADKELWEAISYKLVDTNRLEGKVISVMRDPVAAKVKLELKIPTVIESLITVEAVDDLNLKEGDTVKAIIKAPHLYLNVV